MGAWVNKDAFVCAILFIQQHDNVLNDSPYLIICEDTLVSRIMKLAILRYISIKYRFLNHNKVRFERIFQAIVVLCMACMHFRRVSSKLRTWKPTFCSAVNDKLLTNAKCIIRLISQNCFNFEAFFRHVNKIAQAKDYLYSRTIPK